MTGLVQAGPWAPWIVELGNSHEEQHFGRTAEAVQAVSMALPHLSPEVRRAAIEWLDRQWHSGVPLDRPAAAPEGRRREHYDLSPAVLAGPAAKPPGAPAELGDLYAVWAYAHYAGRQEQVCAGSTPSAPWSATIWPGRCDSTPTSGTAGPSSSSIMTSTAFWPPYASCARPGTGRRPRPPPSDWPG